jgi:hypothetical protein
MWSATPWSASKVNTMSDEVFNWQNDPDLSPHVPTHPPTTELPSCEYPFSGFGTRTVVDGLYKVCSNITEKQLCGEISPLRAAIERRLEVRSLHREGHLARQAGKRLASMACNDAKDTWLLTGDSDVFVDALTSGQESSVEESRSILEPGETASQAMTRLMTTGPWLQRIGISMGQCFGRGLFSSK